MLMLEPHHRDVMLKNGILGVSESGEEALRGLTVMESIFVMDFECGGLIDPGLAEMMIYNMLIVRHQTAKALHRATRNYETKMAGAEG
jgi:hypothetical protein